MASYTYEQLKVMKVNELRDIAKDHPHPALEGYTTMHKDHLLPALCKVLNIHIHHTGEGSQKARVKAAMRKLKARRKEVMSAGESAKLSAVRRQIHVLKHKLRVMVERADELAKTAAPAAAPAPPAGPAAPAPAPAAS